MISCRVPGSLVSDPEAIHAAVSMLTKDTRHRDMRCLERRCDTRLPFQRPVQVTPLNEHEESIDPDGPETMTAYTRDISPSGVGFLHDQPINSNRVLLSFELLGGKMVSLVVQLTWCRYVGDFLHSSGGRLVGLVVPPSQICLGTSRWREMHALTGCSNRQIRLKTTGKG